MRKILLATTLLLIAVSENILVENHPRLKTAWICDKQLCNKRTKRIPRKDIPSKLEESLNYDDDRQFPRISDTRFISESRKLPSLTLIRRSDLARFPQVDLSSDKSKLDSIKPRVLISIGIQEETNTGNDLQENCSTKKNYLRLNQGWQVQKPFYVEEPRWIDIDVDYIDSSQHVDNDDPYILTRGKKMYRIQNPEQVNKMIENYEATLDYPNKNKRLSIKNRVRRFVKMNGRFQTKTTDEKNDEIKEKNYNNSLQDISRDINNTAIFEIENRENEKSSEIDKMSEEAEKTKDTSHDVFIKNYEKDDLKNLAKRSLRGLKFTKQNQISNGVITDFVEQKQKIQREDIPNDIENSSSKTTKIGQVERYNKGKSFAINTNKRNKRTVLLKNQELPETRKKRETYEIDANSKKDVETNETYQQMKNKAYVNKLNNLGTSDNLSMLPRDKVPFNNEIESLNKKDTERNNKSIEKAWKLHYAHRKKLESEGEAKNEIDSSEINNDNIEITDLQLSESDSKNSETQARSNYREKRNICKLCKIKPFQQDEWLKNIEKEIQESLSLERRDKHNDILERLSLLEPYVISRGKKSPEDFEKDDLSSMSNSRNTNDENRAKVMSLPVAESLLRMLLMEMSKCNNGNCDINANRLSDQRLSPRDRRGTLDEILATYDPYYVARGKRMNRNQKGVSFETDAKQ